MLRTERSSHHCTGRRPEQAALKKRVQEIAETRVRYGYRRNHVLLRRKVDARTVAVDERGVAGFAP